MARYVSEAVIRRLPGYYRQLKELEALGIEQISSQELGLRMNLTPSQIRQDINCFGGFGRQGYGYNVTNLKNNLAHILGIDQHHSMIIVGVGHIGYAISQYKSFMNEGFETVAAFDQDPAKIGKEVSGVTIQDIKDLESWLSGHTADMAVLCVPAAAAKETAERLISCGVKAIWNFAPTDLPHGDDVIVVDVHLSDSLDILSYKIAHQVQE